MRLTALLVGSAFSTLSMADSSETWSYLAVVRKFGDGSVNVKERVREAREEARRAGVRPPDVKDSRASYERMRHGELLEGRLTLGLGRGWRVVRFPIGEGGKRTYTMAQRQGALLEFSGDGMSARVANEPPYDIFASDGLGEVLFGSGIGEIRPSGSGALLPTVTRLSADGKVRTLESRYQGHVITNVQITTDVPQTPGTRQKFERVRITITKPRGVVTEIILTDPREEEMTFAELLGLPVGARMTDRRLGEGRGVSYRYDGELPSLAQLEELRAEKEAKIEEGKVIFGPKTDRRPWMVGVGLLLLGTGLAFLKRRPKR